MSEVALRRQEAYNKGFDKIARDNETIFEEEEEEDVDEDENAALPDQISPNQRGSLKTP